MPKMITRRGGGRREKGRQLLLMSNFKLFVLAMFGSAFHEILYLVSNQCFLKNVA